MCVAGFTVDAELLARSQYSEYPATGHLDTDISWFPCVYKQMLRRLPTLPVATKFIINQLHILFTCEITTATGRQPNCS